MKKLVVLTATVGMLGATAAISQTTNQMQQQPQAVPQTTGPQQQTSPPVGVPPTPQVQTPGSQTTTTPMKQPPGQQAFMGQQQPNQMLASNLMRQGVLGSNNERIGDISDLLMSQDGQVVAVLVGVGGFLGIGEKNVAIPFDSVQRSPETNQLTVSYSREDLEQAPEFVTLDRGTGTTGTSTTGTGTTGTGTTGRGGGTSGTQR